MIPSRTSYAALLALATALASHAEGQPSPPRATITRDLRLDANEEDFPRVRFVYVGPQGQMAIPILNDQNLRIYDSTGKRLAVVGRRGFGPGEFQELFPVGWKGDTIWVNDNSQRRITFIGPDHKVLRTTLAGTFDVGPSDEERRKARADGMKMEIPTFSIAGILADGTIIGWGHRRWQEDTPAQRAFGAPSPMVRVEKDRKQVTIAILPWGGDPRWGMAVDGFGNYVPFMMPPQVAVSTKGDRIAHVWAETKSNGGTFTVSAFRANGDTMFVRTFPFAGVPIPARLRDSAVAVFTRPRGEGSAALGLKFAEMAEAKMPTVYSGAEQLLIGLDATFWVGLRRTDAGQRFLVLNSKGDPVAAVDLPPRTRLMQASATRLYAVETDPDGLQSVIRYAVSGISCGAVPCR